LTASISDGGRGRVDEAYSLVLEQEKSKVTGFMNGSDPVSGFVSGSKVTLTITQSLTGQGQKIVYEGYFVGANAMKGTVRVAGGGSWYAKRDPVRAQ
jgi:hypothetical protein